MRINVIKKEDGISFICLETRKNVAKKKEEEERKNVTADKM
jgi:hypothetical protein